MKMLALGLAVAAALAFTTPIQASVISSCNLVQVSYWIKVEKGQPYLYVQGFTDCPASTTMYYKWEVATTEPLSPLPYWQYTRGYDTEIQKFRLFYIKNRSGRQVINSAGVTFTYGSSDFDYQTFGFLAKNLSGVVTIVPASHWSPAELE